MSVSLASSCQPCQLPGAESTGGTIADESREIGRHVAYSALDAVGEVTEIIRRKPGEAGVRLAVAALFPLAACQQQPLTRNEAIELANEYVVNEGGSLNGIVPHAEERGGNWIVSYDFEPPQIGGMPVFAIDKQTREIRVVARFQ